MTSDKTEIFQAKAYNKMETIRTLRDYGRFLGIRGLWRKNKESLKEYLLDKVFEEINERMIRRPTIDPFKAYIEVAWAPVPDDNEL